MNHDYSFDQSEPNLEVNKEYQWLMYVRKESLFIQEKLDMRKNKFSVGYYGNTSLLMERYYKDDWNGLYINYSSLKNQPIEKHTYAINCKHLTEDVYSIIFNNQMKTYQNKK